jgi:hypothetical protein
MNVLIDGKNQEDKQLHIPLRIIIRETEQNRKYSSHSKYKGWRQF